MRCLFVVACTAVLASAAGCSDPPAAPAPPAPVPARVTTSSPTVDPMPQPSPTSSPPAEPPPARDAESAFGEVMELSPDRSGDDGVRTVLVEVAPVPRPSGPIVAFAPIHHGWLAMREIATEPTPDVPIVVVDAQRLSRCETRARRARRLHSVTTAEDGEEGLEATYLALELEGCPRGLSAAVGARPDDVVATRLTRSEFREPAPIELVDLVRETDAEYADPPAAADYRVLALPAVGITIVVGNQAHVIRDGRELHDRWGGSPETVVAVGGRAFFELSSPSDGWSSRLECFHPSYLEAPCEIVDPSGTPTNVRAGPSGRSPVLTTLEPGARPSADDHVGSWFHVTTTPAGWVHESAIRCPALPAAPRACD